MKILLLGPGSDSLLRALDTAAIEYTVQKYSPPPGVVVASTGDHLTILGGLVAIVPVLRAWQKAKGSRKLMITIKNNKVVNFEADGFSQEESQELFLNAVKIAAIDTEKPEKK